MVARWSVVSATEGVNINIYATPDGQFFNTFGQLVTQDGQLTGEVLEGQGGEG